MVLDSLSSSLQSALDRIGSGRIDEEAVDAVVKEIQRALLSSDVKNDIVQEVSEEIRKRALGDEPPAGVSTRDYVLQIVYEELVTVVGDQADIPLEQQTILLVGVQGSGKTTSAGKLAWWFEKKGLRAGLVQTDSMRPGAFKQLEQLSAEAEVEYYGDNSASSEENARIGIQKEISDTDVKIVDTAGRHASEEKLIEEIKKLSDVVNPDTVLLVLDAAIGKEGKEQARKFEQALGIDGIIITKMDGSAKGGGALTAIEQTGSRIAFLGTGESVQNIERFDPEGFVSRLVGQGDLKQLSERVERARKEAETDDEWSPEDVFDGEYTLIDMQNQLKQLQSMGSLSELLSFLPGGIGGMLGNIDDEVIEVGERQFQKYTIIINSMTDEELRNPDIVNSSRTGRIARGSGVREEDVREMLQQYNQMREMFGQFNSPDDAQDMMRNLKQGGRNLF